MKAVLISIKPKWCELIASGEKTVEVRKTRPKIDTPFKVYIYCTKDYSLGEFYTSQDLFAMHVQGKVIGEFVCDKIVRFKNSIYDEALEETVVRSCVPMYDLLVYIGKQNYGYGWHISDLVIYDKPRELSEFYTLKKCHSCESGYESTACIYDEDCRVPTPITRPFQSWGYVESEDTK